MKKVDHQYRNKAWYALRRTLPPWSWKKNLRELVKYCPEYGIDEVIVKVDTEEFCHGIPSLEWLKKYQAVLYEIKQALNGAGVVFSINPFVTLGHADRGRSVKKVFPEMGFMVGHDGSQCEDCACPLSSCWREHTVALWKIYAETGPDTIWVEDDIRTFNHLPVQTGCFCPEHMSRFSEEVARTISREELVGLILKPGEPHPYRATWLDLQGEIMVEVAELLGKAVHEISPQTKIGLMSSGPDHHCAEGRKWHAFTFALAGNQVPVSRPPLGNYSETNLKGLYFTANSLRRTRYVLPQGTIEMAEIENYPFSQYNKSNTFTFLQASVCFAMGVHGVTMNLFDHGGTPMAEDMSILNSLKSNKTFLKALSDRCVPGGTFKGIKILHHDRCSYHKHLSKNARFSDLQEDSFGWENPLQAMGFSTTYEKSNLIALSGQSLRCLEHQEIMEIIAGGALCDLTATATLISMGYGEYLGVDLEKTFKRGEVPLAAEHFFNPDFGGRQDRYFALTIFPNDATVGNLLLHPGAMAVSELVDPDTKRLYSGLTLFENSLGGRMAVYPLDINWLENRFSRPARQIQMSRILEWLSRNTIPLLVKGGHNILPFRMDYEDKIIIGMFCLSLDSWNEMEIIAELNTRKINYIRKVDELGEWHLFSAFKQQDHQLILSFKEELTHRKPLIFEIILQ